MKQSGTDIAVDTLWCGPRSIGTNCRSKYAFLFFEGMTIVSFLVCLATLPKSLVKHNIHQIRHKLQRLFGNHDEAERHKTYHDDQEKLLRKTAEPTDEHLHPEMKDKKEIASPKQRMASAEL